VALALSYLAMGWMFVGVTLVAAQVAGSGRGTLGLASIVLGVSFVVRAVGDVADSAIRWASPMAWPQSVRAFAGEQWWVLGLCVAVGAVLVVSGFWLSTRRDLGSGFLTPAAGRARAGRMLRHPVGFAVHLHRWALLSWTLAMFVLGLVYASVADDIEEMMVDNPVYADLLAQLQGADPTESYLATVLVMQALMVAGYAIATVLHLHTEEASSRVEQVLATATSRTRWMASYLTLAAAGTVVITVASSLGTGLSYAWVTDDGAQVGRLVVAGLVTLPAVAVLAGVTVALFGWWPRGVAGAWGVLAATTVVAILAEVLRLPTWVRQLSPFTHLPKVPAEAVHWPPVLILSAVAVALTAAGVWGFNRRDIQAH
jgi:ABC-2 type transport system permease protein